MGRCDACSEPCATNAPLLCSGGSLKDAATAAKGIEKPKKGKGKEGVEAIFVPAVALLGSREQQLSTQTVLVPRLATEKEERYLEAETETMKYELSWVFPAFPVILLLLYTVIFFFFFLASSHLRKVSFFPHSFRRATGIRLTCRVCRGIPWEMRACKDAWRRWKFRLNNNSNFSWTVGGKKVEKNMNSRPST